MDPRRKWAAATSVIGAVILLVGIIGWATAGDDAGTIGAGSSVTTASATSTVASDTTPGTTETSTTTQVTTTSSTTTSTAATTTTVAPETVEEFIAAYAAALEVGDLDFLYERLYPTVVERFGAEACRSYIDSDISVITDYRLTGPVEGPEPRQVETPSGAVTVDVFDAAVTFTYLGQEFEVIGNYALVDGEMRWFTDCG